MLRKFFHYLPASSRLYISRLRQKIFDTYAVSSYSQEGEDMILRRVFENKKNGFYVDVGAHHPRRFSNTYFFYKLGWRGLNIEPNPEVFPAFQSVRKHDTNLQLGVAEKTGSLVYYEFNEPALNTFDSELVNARLATTAYKIVATSNILVDRLDNILERYLTSATQIDFLSIDVEGLDFSVLKSNDWGRFRPKFVLVEVLETTLEDAMQGAVFKFMKTNGYDLFAKTYNTLFFREQESASFQIEDGSKSD